MKKKAKKIILWVVGIWIASALFFGTLSVLFDNVRESSVEPQSAQRLDEESKEFHSGRKPEAYACLRHRS